MRATSKDYQDVEKVAMFCQECSREQHKYDIYAVKPHKNSET